MSKTNLENLSGLSLLELFRIEVETQSRVLTEGFLALERQTEGAAGIQELMRAAHSLKGAARIVNRKSAVRIAHAMEECLLAAQRENRRVPGGLIDKLLEGVDFIGHIAKAPEDSFSAWETGQVKNIETFVKSLCSLDEAVTAPEEIAAPPNAPAVETTVAASAVRDLDRVLHVTTENLNGLMGLAGEVMVSSRWLEGFAPRLSSLKRKHQRISDCLNRSDMRLRNDVIEFRETLAGCISDLDHFERRFLNFSSRLYHEVLDCRMRPFSDALQGLHRTVRDVAKALGKQAKLEIEGEATLVDRDILERIKSPIDHILRNAIDHGIEPPEQRREQGKPAEGTLRIHAAHSAGLLRIVIADDGAGVDIEAVRRAVMARKLTTSGTARAMSAAELFEFLFLPGFTLKETASEISGRGVGLDAVQVMMRQVGGRARVTSQPGCGTRLHLELPLTLSVVRTLLAEIGGEPYAFPLARLERATRISRDQIEAVQGCQHFALEGNQVGLVSAAQALGLKATAPSAEEVSIIVVCDGSSHYGVVVDRFLGERELVIRSLDPRLGKIRNISSAALMPDGSPVLVIDVDDLLRSISNLATERRFNHISQRTDTEKAKHRKRVLVVDDSLTVRELERKLLESHGYAVDVAIDGMDGWNAVRAGKYELVVTDVDMPRMDGIELLKLIRKDARLKSLPVAIVSYKDRPEDKERGMDAGADYYLTKASFHDETLLGVVRDLIGGVQS